MFYHFIHIMEGNSFILKSQFIPVFGDNTNILDVGKFMIFIVCYVFMFAGCGLIYNHVACCSC